MSWELGSRAQFELDAAGSCLTNGNNTPVVPDMCPVGNLDTSTIDTRRGPTFREPVHLIGPTNLLARKPHNHAS